MIRISHLNEYEAKIKVGLHLHVVMQIVEIYKRLGLEEPVDWMCKHGACGRLYFRKPLYSFRLLNLKIDEFQFPYTKKRDDFVPKIGTHLA